MAKLGARGKTLPAGACSGMFLPGAGDQQGKRQAPHHQTFPANHGFMPPRGIPEHVLAAQAQAMLESIGGLGVGSACPFVDPYVPAPAMPEFPGTGSRGSRPAQVPPGTRSIIPVSLSNDFYADPPHLRGSDSCCAHALVQSNHRPNQADRSLASVLGSAPPPPKSSSAVSIEPPPGLGASQPPPSMEVPETLQQQQVASLRRQVLRQAIVRFYYEHRPEKLNSLNFVDALCGMYEGREAELDVALRNKYGSGLHPPGLPAPGLGYGQPRMPSPNLTHPITVPEPAQDQGPPSDEPMFVGQSSSWHQTMPASPLDTGVPMPSLAARHMQVDQPVEASSPVPDVARAAEKVRAPEAKGIQALLEELDRYRTDQDIDMLSGDDAFEVSEEVAQAIISSRTIQNRRRLLEEAAL